MASNLHRRRALVLPSGVIWSFAALLAVAISAGLNAQRPEPDKLPPADDWQGIAEFLGRPLPELPERTLSLDRLEGPLPEGVPVTTSEANRIARQIQAAWQNAAAIPPRRLVVSETNYEPDIYPSPHAGPIPRVDLIEPGRWFRHTSNERWLSQETATLRLGDDVFEYERLRRRYWQRMSQRTDATEPAALTMKRTFPDDEFPYAAADMSGNDLVDRRMRDDADAYAFQRIARIDETRYRVDFAPFEVPVREGRDDRPTEVQQWSMILRSDLDWVPEESMQVHRIEIAGPHRRFERRMSQTFVRVGDYVVLSERVATQRLVGIRMEPTVFYARYVTELDPKYADRVFNPVALAPAPSSASEETP